jgi:hypothetical protein
VSALWTPRLLVPRVVREAVAPGQPGAYALGNDRGGFQVGYIGRSDYCLRTRLLTHNYLYEFEYFVLRYAAGVLAAFQVECELYHVYRQAGAPLANRVHPAAPSFRVACPYCDFASAWQKTIST